MSVSTPIVKKDRLAQHHREQHTEAGVDYCAYFCQACGGSHGERIPRPGLPSIFNTPPHYPYYTYPVEQTEPIMTLVEVDDSTWEQEIELAALPTLVMFYSTTCQHCKQMEPYFTAYAQEYAGKIRFARLNILENPFTVERYGIMATPTFKFFCQGKPVQELVGAAYPALLKKLIEDSLVYGKECIGKSTPVRFDPAYA